MATVEWTDERLNDAFERLHAEMAAMRADMKKMRAELKAEIAAVDARVAAAHSNLHADVRMLWVTFVAGCISLVAALIATQV
jgi:Tfp pilus assembly protein FimV